MIGERCFIFEVVVECKFIYVLEAFSVAEDDLRPGIIEMVSVNVEMHGLMIVGRNSDISIGVGVGIRCDEANDRLVEGSSGYYENCCRGSRCGCEKR